MTSSVEPLVYALADEAATQSLGQALGAVLLPGVQLQLHGELGAGKTTLVRGLLRAFGHTGIVKSPTYGLVESYTFEHLGLRFKKLSKIYFYHFDFYRFNDESEWLDAGFDEYFNGRAICVIEWPERAGDRLPAADIDITLRYVDATRSASVNARSELGQTCLARLVRSFDLPLQ